MIDPVVAARIDALLEALLPTGGRLADAMRYAVLGPGKRLRPVFALEAARLAGADEDQALRAGCAIELIHAYSLIHDDLPCMDDDDLRRGRPTVHKAFDEATAVLAGDALQSLAFEVMADAATHPDGAVRADLVLMLARASGQAGMAGGQMLDLIGDADIELMQSQKTGALIMAAFEAPFILAKAPWAARNAILDFARDLGLAYQIADDLLDVEGDPLLLGKAVGKDDARGKANLVTLQGARPARDTAQALALKAKTRLDFFGERATPLKVLFDYVLERRY